MAVPAEFWKLTSVGLFTALSAGAPLYFGIGPLKPDRVEVSAMIAKEAPIAISAMIQEIRGSQRDLEVRQARMDENIEEILRAVRK